VDGIREVDRACVVRIRGIGTRDRGRIALEEVDEDADRIGDRQASRTVHIAAQEVSRSQVREQHAEKNDRAANRTVASSHLTAV
jgi:hypothetical protein